MLRSGPPVPDPDERPETEREQHDEREQGERQDDPLLVQAGRRDIAALASTSVPRAGRCFVFFPGSLCTFGAPSLKAEAESAGAVSPGPWNLVIIQ